MSNLLTIIIIGIYTIIYVIVFFVQKSQIDNQKSILNSMKMFMETFDVNKVKDFVRMNEETVKMRYDKLLSEDEKLNQIVQDAIESNAKIFEDYNKREFGADHMELVMFALNTLKQLPKDKRQEAFKKAFPRTKRYLVA